MKNISDTAMMRPTSEHCRRTFRQIQAHCAIRASVRVGAQMRLIVGATGDMTSLSPAALQTKFVGRDYAESLRLLELARHNQRRKRHEPED